MAHEDTHRRFGLRSLLIFVTWCAVMLGSLVTIRKLDRVGWASTTSYVEDLNSSDSDTVLHGFYFLTARKDAVAVPRALELLHSSDDYVWLNAAQYLGACEHREAIPYLIKALRHTAWRTDTKTVAYLQHLTNQKFGADYSLWRQWWQQQPEYDVAFDWDSRLGHAPRRK